MADQNFWRPQRGETVRVLPQPGRGCEYFARVEMIEREKVRIKPIGPALSLPAWANSRRARWVKTGHIMPVSEQNA